MNTEVKKKIEKFTFPKLPFPSTVRKWKSSTAYFLNLGIVVAGAVIRPDRWNCANVYDVSVGDKRKKWFNQIV